MESNREPTSDGSEANQSTDDGDSPARINGPGGEGNVPDGDPLTCVACGAAIDRDEWHPVRTWTDADGGFHIDAFCSMECREEHEPDGERSGSA